MKPQFKPRHDGHGTYPAVSTVVVSPIPEYSAPLGTGVSSSAGDVKPTAITNTTQSSIMGSGSATTALTTTISLNQTVTRTKVRIRTTQLCSPVADMFSQTVYTTKEGSSADGQNTAAPSTGSGADYKSTSAAYSSSTTRTVTVESVGSASGDVDASQTTEPAGEFYPSSVESVTGGSAEPQGTGCAAGTTVTKTVNSTITVVSFCLDNVSQSPLLKCLQTATPTAATSSYLPGTEDGVQVSLSTEDAGYGSSSSPMPVSSTGSPASAKPTSPSGSPVPYNNGTAPASTSSKKKCAGSGFMTMPKPSSAAPSYTAPGYKRL
jgi:hypothetical protein